MLRKISSLLAFFFFCCLSTPLAQPSWDGFNELNQLLKNAEGKVIREPVVDGIAMFHELKINRQRLGPTGMTLYRERKDDKNDQNWIVYDLNWAGVKWNFYQVREEDANRPKYKHMVNLVLTFAQAAPMVPYEGYPLTPPTSEKINLYILAKDYSAVEATLNRYFK